MAELRSLISRSSSEVDLYIPFERDAEPTDNSYAGTFTATATEMYMWVQTGGVYNGYDITIDITKLSINPVNYRIKRIWQNQGGEWVHDSFTTLDNVEEIVISLMNQYGSPERSQKNTEISD